MVGRGLRDFCSGVVVVMVILSREGFFTTYSDAVLA
jgi:hypothetical protein